MPQQGIPVLTYHAIDTADHMEFPMSISVSAVHFREQMEWLHREGYKSISKEELSNVILGEKPRDKYILITFDDGYLSLYKYAADILSQYGFTATLFLSTAYMGRTYDIPDFDFVKYDRQLTWDELKVLQTKGWSIQSHGNTHIRLKNMDRKLLAHEMALSKSLIEQNLGTVVDEFAYPYGLYSSNVIKEVKAAGYRFAYTVHTGKILPKASCYRLPRIMIYNTDTIDVFRTKVITGHPSAAVARRAKIRDFFYAHPAIKDFFEKVTPYLGIGNR